MRRQARPSKTRIPAGAAHAARSATLPGMPTITEDFQALEAQFGHEAVKEFAVAAYESDLEPLVKAGPEDIAAIGAKIDQLILIVGKLVSSEASEDDGPATVAKSNGRLSDDDRAAVAAMASGF
ncbi:MAG: hypothetical protein ACR2IP_11430 [Solirubrobacteraceae bacterium]